MRRLGILLIGMTLVPTLLETRGRAASGAATTAVPLTLENIVANNRGAREAMLSPDGRWTAVSASAAEGNGIFLVPVDERGGAARLWAQGSGPVWFPDGKSILFTRGDDLWTIAMGSTDARQITQGGEDERAPAIAPDGRTIAFYSTRSGHQDIWLVPATGGTPRKLTDRANAQDDFRFAAAWSPDGRQIAYVSNTADYWHDDVWIVDVLSGAARQLSKGLMASSTPSWSPNGQSIALLGTSKSEYWYEDLAYVYLLDPRQGTEHPVKMQVYGTDWLHSQSVFWSKDGKQIYFLYLERGDFNLWAVPSAGGVATRVTNMSGAVRSFHTPPDASAFVFVRSTQTRGSDVDYIPAGGGPLRRLTHFSDEWTQVTAPREISYRSWDGLYIQGFLYLPPSMKAGERYPALVQVHGGGTNSYLNGQNLLEQYMASRGYVVLAINYRGGSGFGRAFQDLSVNDWAHGQALDAAATADVLRALPYCSGKVGIYGYSYGGIMTMAAIARAPGKFDAAVPMAGIYDFGDALQNADRLGKIFTRTGHGGDPKDRKEIYAISNTLDRMKDITTPLLIMHGEADVRAPYRQYELAVALLRKYGKTFESKSYPGEPHGFRNPKNRLDMYQRMEAFLDRYLKPAS